MAEVELEAELVLSGRDSLTGELEVPDVESRISTCGAFCRDKLMLGYR